MTHLFVDSYTSEPRPRLVPRAPIPSLSESRQQGGYEGADNKSKLYVSTYRSSTSSVLPLTLYRTIFFLTLTRNPIFCPISLTMSIAVDDSAINGSCLTSFRAVFEVKNRGRSQNRLIPVCFKKDTLSHYFSVVKLRRVPARAK